VAALQNALPRRPSVNRACVISRRVINQMVRSSHSSMPAPTILMLGRVDKPVHQDGKKLITPSRYDRFEKGLLFFFKRDVGYGQHALLCP
jgi:hypothetical protein